jgi:putative transposase
MQKWRQWETVTEIDWGVAVEREAVIRSLADEEKLTKEQLEGAMLRLGLSRSALYKLIHRYKQRPQTSSLLPWKRGRDSNVKVLSPKQEDLLQACVREFYLTPERPSIAALMREIKRRFSEGQLPTPVYRTVRRRLEALDLRLVIRKREGAKRAREKLGPVLVSTLRSDLPLDIVQIDHTLADVIVVDQEHRKPIGRPWLSLAVDIASRAVLGFSISLESPSALSVSLALSHAVLSKTNWLADRELQNLAWPMGGLPRLIHVDNAKEFHSEALVRGCQEYGIALEHRGRRQPHLGGHIERLIGTMMGEVHLLPGTTFSNPREKDSYDSEGCAILTLPELERWLALQIAGVYNLSLHSALEKSPLAAWQEGMGRRKQPIRYPGSAEEFFLDFLPAVPRKIQKDGIHFHKIRYWHNVLSRWAGRLEKPLWVKYDPRNLARVYVRDPDGRHWPVPYADLRQPPIALWELMEARRRLRQEGGTDPSEHALFANILQQRRLLKEAATRSQERRRQERIPTSSILRPMVRPSTRTNEESEDIKPYPVEIWEQE